MQDISQHHNSSIDFKDFPTNPNQRIDVKNSDFLFSKRGDSLLIDKRVKIVRPRLGTKTEAVS